MMSLTISDDILREAGLTERKLLIEMACHLFNRQLLALWPAARLAGLTRSEFEEELIQRRIPIYRSTVEDLVHDLEALERMGA
jgi:predicted HTH domain antitoxin